MDYNDEVDCNLGATRGSGVQSETFGRLLKAGLSSVAACEGKTAPIVEDELGRQIGVAATSIQRYKAGHIPPETRTVAILAEAAVKRGHLNRDWLHAFLHAARYPTAERLLEQLCPPAAPQARPARIYQNLPAPTYSQFVMRAQAYADVVDGLAQRSALVLIASLGGMGKTSLAREVAIRCLGDAGPVHFDAVVWVSDKDRPGSTTLPGLLDEIARTLDYPGFTQFEVEEKRREVEQLLRRQRVLLVVDNFETVADRSLLPWLLRLPEPSKALVTSREYSRAFRNNTFVLDLRGMSETEAQELIAQRLRMLRIDALVRDPAELAPLVAATGGNPKAIEISLGCLKYEHRPFRQVIDDLYAARGELFEDLFSRCWALLDEAARRVLLAMPLFLDSAGGPALGATADVQGFAFDRAVERLTDLALLDAHQADLHSAPRYTLHPLVRAFAASRLGEQPDFEAAARERWMDWYRSLVAQVGYCWDDLTRLELLDAEQDTVHAVAQWTFEHHRYTDTLAMARGAGYYYYVRALWDKQPHINLLRAEAARHLGDLTDEIEALAYHVHMLSRQGNVAEAEAYLNRLDGMAAGVPLPPAVLYEYQYATALYWLARGHLDTAEAAWQRSLGLAAHLTPKQYVIARQWLATCLYQQGKLPEAAALFGESLLDATRLGLQRCIIFGMVRLAAIDLDRGNLDAALAALDDSQARAHQYQDRDNLAQIARLYARAHALRGDLTAARGALTTALDLFERLGMRRELAEARAELARLAAQHSATPDTPPGLPQPHAAARC
jgi:tetratricopeptide (TPR) repeat protein